MALMAEADFIAVFVGIESPDEESLREAKKFQNVRAGGTLVEKVHRIQEAGMEVWCGMIMGFDNDDAGIFDRQVNFVQQARIPFAMTGLLHAIPKTPLYDSVLAEGCIDVADRPEFVTNIRPLKMSPEELRDGYLRVMTELFDPENYFDRTEAAFLRPEFRGRLRESSSCLLEKPQAPLHLDPGEACPPCHRLVFSADAPHRASLASYGILQASLAISQSAPPPGADSRLYVPHGDVRPYHGKDDEHGPATPSSTLF